MIAAASVRLFVLGVVPAVVLTVGGALDVARQIRAGRRRRERETRVARLVASGVLTGLSRGGSARRR